MAAFVLNSGTPNLRLMDAVKRGYDEIVEGFRDPTSGRPNLNQYGRAVNGVRAAYVKDLREMFPRYGSALDAWAGPSRAMDALGMGRRALSNDPEVTAKVIKGLPAADKEFFLTGVARALKDKIEGAADGADATRRIFGNKLIRDKIAAAFDNPAQFEFMRYGVGRGPVTVTMPDGEVLRGAWLFGLLLAAGALYLRGHWFGAVLAYLPVLLVICTVFSPPESLSRRDNMLLFGGGAALIACIPFWIRKNAPPKPPRVEIIPPWR
jgi:hypothetical protein